MPNCVTFQLGLPEAFSMFTPEQTSQLLGKLCVSILYLLHAQKLCGRVAFYFLILNFLCSFHFHSKGSIDMFFGSKIPICSPRTKRTHLLFIPYRWRAVLLARMSHLLEWVRASAFCGGKGYSFPRPESTRIPLEEGGQLTVRNLTIL